MSYYFGCYVRTPESYIEIFQAFVGQTVRFCAQAKMLIGMLQPAAADMEVRFFKNDSWYATAYTRADGWADGDYKLTSGDVGTVYFRAELWRGVNKLATCSKTLAVITVEEAAKQAGVAPPSGVPSTPAPAAPAEMKCFIVTACFDSLKPAQLDKLRGFRDSCLPEQVTRLYYRVSPPIAGSLRKHEALRVTLRKLLEVIL